jgi:glycosyltransferase involved in cell wall biosynthesis
MTNVPISADEPDETTPGSVAVSTMIFTLNEEIHLPSCLDSLAWCDDVIVVDSFSNDGTERICRERGVRFVQRTFDGFGTQRNWALENAPTKYPWVLILDADERVTNDLAREIDRHLRSVPADVGAFRLRRRFHIWGRWLRHSSLYPSWVVRLVHKDRVRYVNRGHGETQTVDGRIEELEHDLIDENLKGIDEWFERQNRYSRQDADLELNQSRPRRPLLDLISRDPLCRRVALKYAAARLPVRGLLYFLYVYVLRGGFLDGRDGLAFCRMRASYQTMIAVKKYDGRRRAGLGGASPAGDLGARPVQPTAPAAPGPSSSSARKSATS